MNLFKKKKNDSLSDEISKDLKEISNKDNTPEIKPSKKVKSNPDELTQDVLDKAVSIAEKENKVWDEITQEERWDYIKEARN